MRGEITFKILSALEEAGEEAMDFLSAYLVAGLGSKGRVAENFGKALELRKNSKKRIEKEKDRSSKHRFYSMVSYLERDGLILKKRTEVGTYVSITDKGRTQLKYFKEESLPPSDYGDSSQNKNGITIITFDVPEQERRKRNWLRCALKNMDFEMIHKSVWMGTDGVAEDFLEDIRDLRLGDYVEIFQINKKGSLNKFEIKNK